MMLAFWASLSTASRLAVRLAALLISRCAERRRSLALMPAYSAPLTNAVCAMASTRLETLCIRDSKSTRYALRRLASSLMAMSSSHISSLPAHRPSSVSKVFINEHIRFRLLQYASCASKTAAVSCIKILDVASTAAMLACLMRNSWDNVAGFRSSTCWSLFAQCAVVGTLQARHKSAAVPTLAIASRCL
uniref:Secreted protein n=1 Tax=Ixodes ricinus TaxID=34613 RepID=A0A6B0V2N9_IXORI